MPAWPVARPIPGLFLGVVFDMVGFSGIFFRLPDHRRENRCNLYAREGTFPVPDVFPLPVLPVLYKFLVLSAFSVGVMYCRPWKSAVKRVRSVAGDHTNSRGRSQTGTVKPLKKWA